MLLDFKDEALTDCLSGIVSALLPHDNYRPDTFGVLYPLIKSILDTKDTRGLFYIMYNVFDRYAALEAQMPKGKFEVRITKERFASALENNLPDFILESKTNVTEIMASEGKSADMTIPTNQQEAMGILYEKSLALYDLCFEKAIAYEDAVAMTVDLRDIIKANLIETGLSIQRAILSTGFKVGRHYYSGPSGWLSYSQHLCREISELEQMSQSDFVANGVEAVTKLESAALESIEPLGEYGIPQLDEGVPMLCKHRLAVFVARENVGKTRIMVCLTASLIRKGVKVFYACGEATHDKIFNSVLSSYIYQEYGLYMGVSDFAGAGYEALSSEDKQIVNSAKARVSTSYLALCTDLEYDNVTSKITYYANQGYEAFFIDHSQSLRGRKGRKIPELVTGLALDCRDLKNQLPIYICVASHPSADTKDLLQKEKLSGTQKSPTAQSQTLSTEADEVFIISDSEYLKTRGLLQWYTYKRRDGDPIEPFYILKKFNVSSYEYDPKYQGTSNIDSGALNGIISQVVADDDEFDEGDEDEMEIDW